MSVHVLERLSASALSDAPPPRHHLVQKFCRATHWINRKGQLCVGSANVALRRLEERGLVCLPPAVTRRARSRPRQLIDDRQALPRLPQRRGAMEEVYLQLIQDQHDPDHLLWNRLIIREHPLKAAPLVGAQLRYLIRSPEGLVGAFGVGPAAYYLECRDMWIGWDPLTRQANNRLVIGLSRFLIRRGIQWPNLASHCYSLLLKRVATDWQERYGVKPVLIETFVDRSTQRGTSLSAANWQRLGQSQGRGRSSCSVRDRPKSRKDVWVYELSPKARQHLLCRREPAVVPRSLFHGLGARSWVDEELDGLDLGDRRLERRFAQMLGARWRHPERSFFRSFGSAAAGKAAYRLIASSQAEVGFQSLLAPHQHQTHRRMAAESVVVLAQDTTPLSYNTLHQTTGLGPVGDQRNPGRGLWLHSLQAFRTDGIPLGCSWAKLWARQGQSDTSQRNEQSVGQKESGRWIEAYQSAARLARRVPQTQLVVCGDRESDIFELFDQTEVAPANLHLLVRAQHDRLLSDGQKLWAQLLQQAVQGTMRVRVPRGSARPARWARLEVRFSAIQAQPPRVALKKSWAPVELYAVVAREIDPPAGQEAIEWVLITDWKVTSLKMAVRLIKWYSLRWGIECWHQTLKDVCKVETRQMETARALARALVLDMIVAWRALMLCRLGREHPALPASLFYSAQELAVLEGYKKKLPQHAQSVTIDPQAKPPCPPPNPKLLPASKRASAHRVSSVLSLYQANILVAMLAGFWARKADGHPGPRLLAQGLIILAALTDYLRLTGQAGPRQSDRPKRPRKPG